MNETFFKIDYFLTDILKFKKIDILTNSFLWYESIYLLNSIIDSKRYKDVLIDKNNGKQVKNIGKKTLGKEIQDIEDRCSLKLQAYIDKDDINGEYILIEKQTLEFDLVNCSSVLLDQLIILRGVSLYDEQHKNNRFYTYLNTINKLFK